MKKMKKREIVMKINISEEANNENEEEAKKPIIASTNVINVVMKAINIIIEK